jgi:hypothetical protein
VDAEVGLVELDPEVSAITGFTLAVLSVMGGGYIGSAVAQALVGVPEGADDFQLQSVATAGIVLLLLLAAVSFGRRALIHEDEEVPGWCRHLAGAAVVVRAVGGALAMVTIVGALVARSPYA